MSSEEAPSTPVWVYLLAIPFVIFYAKGGPLGWFIVGTSCWVLWDAKAIRARRGLIAGLGDLGPTGWFFSCLGLWIAAFPLYLASRGKIRRAAQAALSASLFPRLETAPKPADVEASALPVPNTDGLPPFQSRWIGALLDPALGWLLAFFLLPLAVMFVISFARRGTYGGVEWVFGLTNYARAMSPDYLTIYARTLAMAGATTAVCLLMAYPAAYYIAIKANPRWRNFYLLLAVVPFWTSFLIRTYAWILLLRTEGLVNTLLVSSGLVAEPLKLLYCDFAVLMGLVYGELPFMILPLYTSLSKLDTGLLEAAEDLGASPAEAFRTITLPLTLPGIVVGTVFVFIPSLGAFVTPDLLGGSKSIMIGNRVQDLFASVRDQPFGSAISFLLTLIVLAMLYASMRVKNASEA